MQIVLSVIVLFGCSYVGYGLGQYYIMRHQFIGALITFLQVLKVDISYLKDDLIKVIETHKKNCPTSLQTVLKSYLKTLTEQETITVESLKNNIKTPYLEEPEYGTLLQFFESLGKSDVTSQLELLDQFLAFFHRYYKNAETQKKKYAGLFSKLGVLLGIFLMVILW